jgi:RNA polymerase sigma factor (sigma-70 family)
MKERDQLYDQFHALLGQVQEDLVNYASAISGSQQSGHDLFMEAYWEVLDRFPDIEKKEPRSVRSYFIQVIKHRNYDRYKEGSLTVSFEDDEDLPTEFLSTSPRIVEEQVEVNSLFRQLNGLEPSLRQALLLRSEGVEIEASAGIMGVTSDDFSELLGEAREKMRQRLAINKPFKLGDQETAEEECSYLSVGEICQVLDQPWTRTIRRLFVFKTKAENIDQVESIWEIKFPESIATSLMTKPDREQVEKDWLPVSRIAKELGVDDKWVYRRLLFISSPGKYGQQNIRHTLFLHPDSLEEFRQIRDSVNGPPDSDELTLGQLANQVGKHRKWVKRRIEDKNIKPKLRRGRSGKRIECYSQALLAELRQELAEHSKKGSWVTIPDLVERCGKDRDWIINRLKDFQVESEKRHISGSGRLEDCYPPSVLDELQKLAENHHQALRGWNTRHSLRQKLGKSNNWLKRRLNSLESETEEFLDSQGVVRKFYPPQVFERLLQMRDQQKAERNAPKWYDNQ